MEDLVTQSKPSYRPVKTEVDVPEDEVSARLRHQNIMDKEVVLNTSSKLNVKFNHGSCFS